jgi:hypothetical protein
MKFTSSIIVSSLAGLALADFDQLKANFISVIKNQTVLERSFDSMWAQQMINSIDEYGCWCYFQEDHGKGRGPPANEVDAQCKILHDGYTCIIMDAEAENDECTPWDVPYNSGTGLGLVANDPDNAKHEQAIRKSCQRVNRNNNCGARACMVENYFVMQMFKLFLSGVTFDPSLKHSLGNHHPKDDCPIKEGVKSDKECCGTYPLRFPYKHLDGGRGCCGEHTYNMNVMECCAGNVIKMTC